MASGKIVSYLRGSTAKQGASGLGLEAQRKAVTDFLNGGAWTLVAELVEVESGKRDDRPKLAEALSLCRVHGAVLLIAKLDRLSRDLHFLTGLQKAGVRFVAADMPEANETMVSFMAILAQVERKAISNDCFFSMRATVLPMTGYSRVSLANNTIDFRELIGVGSNSKRAFTLGSLL